MIDLKVEGLKEARKLLSEMMARGSNSRVESMKRQAAKIAADMMLSSIRERLPSTGVIGNYKNSFKVKKVEGGTYMVHSDPNAAKVSRKDRDPKRTILFVVKAPGASGEISDMSQVLIRFSPWPLDGMPSPTNEKEIKVITRLVSEGEVLRLRDSKQKNEAVIRSAILKAGGDGRSFDPDGDLATDFVVVGLRTEFGLAGYKTVPHFGPALAKIEQTLAKELASNTDFVDTFSDPNFSEWSGLPIGNVEEASMTELKSIASFQKKVGK